MTKNERPRKSRGYAPLGTIEKQTPRNMRKKFTGLHTVEKWNDIIRVAKFLEQRGGRRPGYGSIKNTMLELGYSGTDQELYKTFRTIKNYILRHNISPETEIDFGSGLSKKIESRK